LVTRTKFVIKNEPLNFYQKIALESLKIVQFLGQLNNRSWRFLSRREITRGKGQRRSFHYRLQRENENEESEQRGRGGLLWPPNGQYYVKAAAEAVEAAAEAVEAAAEAVEAAAEAVEAAAEAAAEAVVVKFVSRFSVVVSEDNCPSSTSQLETAQKC